MRGFLICFSLFVWCSSVLAQPITLTLQHAPLADAIRLIANSLNLNVIISSAVVGEANLNLHDAAPAEALDLLLVSHGLAKWQEGNVWYVAPEAELIKRKEQELKMQSLSLAAAPLRIRVWQIKYGNAKDIAGIVQDERAALLSKRGNVRVDMRTNVICVQDIEARLIEIDRLISRLDRPVQQILIEARLASVDNDFERELGIDFSVKQTQALGDGLSPDKVATNLPGRYSLAVARLADGSLLDVKLAALEEAGHAKLISSPSLFTANQRPAAIEAGEEVPYQEVSEGGGTAVTFKKAVLALKVLPQVLPGRQVMLQLQINQDRPSHKTVLGVPIISTRQMTTNVTVKTGQTVVLGGIYENNQELAEQRVPFLSRIPLLGLLFTQRSTRDNRRELLIFVTPKIMT